MAAHAIGDNEHAEVGEFVHAADRKPIGEQGIFITLALLADIGRMTIDQAAIFKRDDILCWQTIGRCAMLAA